MRSLEILRDRDLETHPRRVVIAVTAGAGVGGFLSVMGFMVPNFIGHLSSGDTELSSVLIGSAITFPFALLYGAVAWAAGMALLGSPIWWALHRTRFRGWPVAITLGAILPGGFVLAFAHLSADAMGEAAISLHWSAIYAIAGAIVALVVWRVAYREIPGPMRRTETPTRVNTP